MAEPLTLTFGIELEFVLGFDSEERFRERFSPYQDEPEDYDEDDDKNDSYGWGLDRLQFILRDSGFGHWVVGADASIDCEAGPQDRDDDNYYFGIELRSPALPYTAKSLTEIREMCEFLEGFDISVNQSCGLHVHVGNERKGFPLETIKNLCVMTATFERELESLHPPHRIGNRYTRSIGSLFDGISPRDIRRMIKKVETIEDLIQLVQKGKKMHAYNLLHLQSSKDLQTLEFRQHEATLDADAITKWVELTCGLVGKARRFAVQDHLGVREMDAYINQISSIPQLNIIKVLKSLGLEDVASYYDRRGLHNHPRPLWSWADPDQENTMAPYVRPGNRVFLDGQQTVRTVMDSNDNGQQYEQAIRGYDAEIPNHDPRGIQLGVAGSEECAHDSRDRFDTASTKVQFFSWSMPVERLSISQPNGSWSRNTSSTLPIMTRSITTTAEMCPLSRKDLSGRPVSALRMASYKALSSPIRKIPATLAARSRAVSALPFRLIYALGYIPKLGSLSRAVKPTWSAFSVAPKSAKPWTASTSDW